MSLLQRSIDLVTNQNFIQIQELSAVKKTCSFKIKNSMLEGFVAFNFGQVQHLYFRELDVVRYLLAKLVEANLLNEEVATKFISNQLHFDEVLEILESEKILDLTLVNEIKNNFNRDLLKAALFDVDTEYEHVSPQQLSQVSSQAEWLDICSDEEIKKSIGQLILNVYEQSKRFDSLVERGNCLILKSEVDMPLLQSLNIKDLNVPLERILVAVPGLTNYSLCQCLENLELGNVDIAEVEFVYDDHDVVEVIQGAIEESRNNAPVKSNLSLKNPKILNILLESFSLLGGGILFYKLSNFIQMVYSSLLSLQY